MAEGLPPVCLLADGIVFCRNRFWNSRSPSQKGPCHGIIPLSLCKPLRGLRQARTRLSGGYCLNCYNQITDYLAGVETLTNDSYSILALDP